MHIQKQNLEGITHVLIDLDDTLYRNEVIPREVTQNIVEYTINKLGYPKDKDPHGFCQSCYKEYGTTLCGLLNKGYAVDIDDWHRGVHYGVLNYKKHLQPDPELTRILKAIALPKYVITNADKVHMEKVLEAMQLEDIFEGHFYVENIQEYAEKHNLRKSPVDLVCKPDHRAFSMVQRYIGSHPENMLFLDDSVRNIEGGKKFGMYTALVGKIDHSVGADFCVESLKDLPQVCPSLFKLEVSR